MCLGIPGKVTDSYERDGVRMGTVDFGGVRKEVCLAYVPEVTTGDYVIVTYLTKFEKTPLVEETLAVAKDAIGQWHVAGYDIALSSVKAP